MGIYSKIKRLLTAVPYQADTCSEEENLEEELISAQAHLAKLKAMPISAFAKSTHTAIKASQFGLITYSVDNKDDAIARAKATVIELRTKIRLSQRLSKTVDHTERARTLENRPQAERREG